LIVKAAEELHLRSKKLGNAFHSGYDPEARQRVWGLVPLAIVGLKGQFSTKRTICNLEEQFTIFKGGSTRSHTMWVFLFAT